MKVPKRRSYITDDGDDLDTNLGTGDHVIFRQQPKRNFKPNPIGFTADMDEHPKYRKPGDPVIGKKP